MRCGDISQFYNLSLPRHAQSYRAKTLIRFGIVSNQRVALIEMDEADFGALGRGERCKARDAAGDDRMWDLV